MLSLLRLLNTRKLHFCELLCFVRCGTMVSSILQPNIRIHLLRGDASFSLRTVARTATHLSNNFLLPHLPEHRLVVRSMIAYPKPLSLNRLWPILLILITPTIIATIHVTLPLPTRSLCLVIFVA